MSTLFNQNIWAFFFTKFILNPYPCSHRLEKYLNLENFLEKYTGQSKITESWLISFYWVGTFDWNLKHIYNEPSSFIAYRSWRLIIFNVLLLGNGRPFLSDERSRWRHFWLSSHEFKIISNLKLYNNGPFNSSIVSNNVLAMFRRIEIESKYNMCDVRCLATKIDGNSIFNKNTIFCCYGNSLFLGIFKICIQILKPMTKHNEMVLWYDT